MHSFNPSSFCGVHFQCVPIEEPKWRLSRCVRQCDHLQFRKRIFELDFHLWRVYVANYVLNARVSLCVYVQLFHMFVCATMLTFVPSIILTKSILISLRYGSQSTHTMFLLVDLVLLLCACERARADETLFCVLSIWCCKLHGILANVSTYLKFDEAQFVVIYH